MDNSNNKEDIIIIITDNNLKDNIQTILTKMNSDTDNISIHHSNEKLYFIGEHDRPPKNTIYALNLKAISHNAISVNTKKRFTSSFSTNEFCRGLNFIIELELKLRIVIKHGKFFFY
jgi:hypothetical protein